jgi:hypothetical protein
MLQDRAGVKNLDYKAHQTLLKKVDAGKIPLDEFLANTKDLFTAERAAQASK